MMKQITLLAFAVLKFIEVNAQQIQQASSLNAEVASTNTLNWKFDADAHKNATKFLGAITSYLQNDETGEWDKESYERVFCYDENMNDTLIAYSHKDTTTNRWVDIAKVTRKYDAISKTLTRENETITRTKTRTQDTYNDDNLKIQTVFSRWDYNLGRWFYISKNRYSYNADGTLQSDSLYNMFYFSDNEMWKLVGKSNYSYNSDSKLEREMTYKQDWTDENTPAGWRYYNRKTYTYTPEGEIRELIHSGWNNDLAKFIPQERELTTYCEDKHTVYSFGKFDWNKDSIQWIETELKQYHQFETGYPEVCYDITFDIDNPISSYRQLFMYNYDVSNDELILPTVGLGVNETNLFHHLIQYKFDSRVDPETHTRTTASKSIYFYGDIEPTATNELEAQLEVKVYPNPASEYMSIYFESNDDALFKLFDVNGKCVFTRNIQSNERIDVSSFPSGFYIYHLILNNKNISGKVIKK